jgi:hypothetical protein
MEEDYKGIAPAWIENLKLRNNRRRLMCEACKCQYEMFLNAEFEHECFSMGEVNACLFCPTEIGEGWEPNIVYLLMVFVNVLKDVVLVLMYSAFVWHVLRTNLSMSLQTRID